MYVGTEQVIQPFYRDKYVPGLGTFTVRGGERTITQHIYVCDHCGRRSAFHEPAEEPFYCHSTPCGAIKLVSIHPAA